MLVRAMPLKGALLHTLISIVFLGPFVPLALVHNAHDGM